MQLSLEGIIKVAFWLPIRILRQCQYVLLRRKVESGALGKEQISNGIRYILLF